MFSNSRKLFALQKWNWNEKDQCFRSLHCTRFPNSKKHYETKRKLCLISSSCALQVAIETIYVAIQTFVYSLILYSMIGFHWRVDKFLWFYYYVLMCFVYFTLYGMMLVALTPGYQVAAICMSFFLSFWNLFSGFMIPRTVSTRKLPVWYCFSCFIIFRFYSFRIINK